MTNKVFSMPRGDELRDLIDFCKVMSESTFYKNLGAGGVLSIVLTAKELNLPMMPCLNGGLINIEGRVSLSSQMMNALLIINGHSANLVQLDEEKCVIDFKRSDSPEIKRYTYTKKDAEIAGYLKKLNWVKHLKDMLYCRCLSGGARKFMPDALMGCYIQGEIESDITPSPQIEENKNIQKKEEPLKIEFQKVDGFDEFFEKNRLNEDNDKAKFIKNCAKEMKRSFDEIVNVAVQNPERFEIGFEKWINPTKQKKVSEES